MAFDDAVQADEMARLVAVLMPHVLSGDDVRLATLRQQWAMASVEVRDGSPCGLYAHFMIPPSAARVGRVSGRGGIAEIPVQGCHLHAGYVLYVPDGALAFLEVYNFEEWPGPPFFGAPRAVEVSRAPTSSIPSEPGDEQ